MVVWQRSLWIGAAAALGLCAATATPASAESPLAETQPPRVMTDSQEYCEHLSSQAAALERPLLLPPIEALVLASEGRRLCAQGHLRPGIARLRRAILLLRAAPAPPAPDD